MMCIDTDIASSCATFQEAARDMNEALAGYLHIFSSEEIEAREFIRPTVLRYRIAWFLGLLFQRTLHLIKNISTMFMRYDLTDRSVRFAS